MMTNTRPLAVALTTFLLTHAACTTEPEGDGPDDGFAADGKGDVDGLTDDSPEARAVLRVVNTRSLEELDNDVSLSSRAAKKIVAYRLGRDGKHDTFDDQPIDTLAELDAIAYVGPVALDHLIEFATALTWQEAIVPALYGWNFDVKIPVHVTRWTSGTTCTSPVGPTVTEEDTTHSESLLLELASYGVARLYSSSTRTYVRFGDDGTFTVDLYESGVSETTRSVYSTTGAITGYVDGLGRVIITSYSERSSGGNSLYGYKCSRIASTAEGHGELPLGTTW